jgi:hypothetical protein
MHSRYGVWNYFWSIVSQDGKLHRQYALNKNQDSDIWITELEDLRMKLEELGSSITDNQFMIHILNNMTSDYDLQLVMMEKRIDDKIYNWWNQG